MNHSSIKRTVAQGPEPGGKLWRDPSEGEV